MRKCEYEKSRRTKVNMRVVLQYNRSEFDKRTTLHLFSF